MNAQRPKTSPLTRSLLIAVSAVALSACQTFGGGASDSAMSGNSAMTGSSASIPGGMSDAADRAWQAGNYRQSLNYYSLLFQRAPDNRMIRARYAESLRRLGKPQRAIEVLEPVVVGTDAAVDELLTYAKANLQLRNSDEALKAALRATDVAPTNGDALQMLGLSLASTDQHEAAIAAFETALKAGTPDTALTLNNLGLSQVRAGNVESSLDSLRKAQSMAPTNQSIARNLAMVEKINQDRANDGDERLITAKEMAEDTVTPDFQTAIMMELPDGEADAKIAEQIGEMPPKPVSGDTVEASSGDQHSAMVMGGAATGDTSAKPAFEAPRLLEDMTSESEAPGKPGTHSAPEATITQTASAPISTRTAETPSTAELATRSGMDPNAEELVAMMQAPAAAETGNAGTGPTTPSMMTPFAVTEARVQAQTGGGAVGLAASGSGFAPDVPPQASRGVDAQGQTTPSGAAAARLAPMEYGGQRATGAGMATRGNGFSPDIELPMSGEDVLAAEQQQAATTAAPSIPTPDDVRVSVGPNRASSGTGRQGEMWGSGDSADDTAARPRFALGTQLDGYNGRESRTAPDEQIRSRVTDIPVSEDELQDVALTSANDLAPDLTAWRPGKGSAASARQASIKSPLPSGAGARVRIGRHQRYDRIVIDQPTGFKAQLIETSGGFRIDLPAGSKASAKRIEGELKRSVSDARIASGNAGISIDQTPGTTRKVWRSGDKLVIDLYPAQ
ncbi:MAG: hypothetical protein Alpg2KO_17380 [Alphaproteobacteria bacterium]